MIKSTNVIWQITSVVRKLLGLVVYWFVVPFRGYARSIVHSYCLQSDNYTRIKRLDERFPQYRGHLGGWILNDVHEVGHNGFVKNLNVSKIHFWLVVFLLWGWVDDDSNEDTYSEGHCLRYTDGDLRHSIMGTLFRKQLLRAVIDGTYGNSFDLGNYRAKDPKFNFIAALIWNTRNSAYNFQYLLIGD